jgi:exonuclease VII large subunit
MAAIRREIKEVEAQLEAAEKDFAKINDKLRIVQQDRSNVEEELAAQNTRLKQMLDELALRKEQAEAEGQGLDGVRGSKMTMAELDRKVDAALLDVLEVKLREHDPTHEPVLALTPALVLTLTLSIQAKFRDEAFATAIIEQSAATGGDKVRVEFEGDEVFWTLQENYTFEMLLMDAARYWDVSPQDAVLADERGAVWPDDAYVALELVSAPQPLTPNPNPWP